MPEYRNFAYNPLRTSRHEPDLTDTPVCGAPLVTEHELSRFLAEVERRAFKQACFAVQDEHQALDIVQDAMLKLADKYAGRPAEELPMLFQVILQNTIRDHYRRSKVRSAWTTLLSCLVPRDHEDNDDYDPLDNLEVESQLAAFAAPDQQLENAQIVAAVEDGLKKLPARQREAFLLRYWEDMDVAQTATIMGCSEGSVKTHCSRATHALAEMLRARGIKL